MLVGFFFRFFFGFFFRFFFGFFFGFFLFIHSSPLPLVALCSHLATKGSPVICMPRARGNRQGGNERVRG